MKPQILFTLFCFSIIGCNIVGEKNTSTDTIIINPLFHSIKIAYYENGSIVDSIILVQGAVKKVSSINNRGKGSGLTYPGVVIAFFDSALISFDDTVEVIHYPKKVDSTNSLAIFYQNSRNVFNEYNYERHIINEKTDYIKNEYRYQFIEEDYLYARDK
ncbi:MAG: hypothetical protein KBB37_13605 [Bacteroidia bacterium]|nr:hypothetical protein [Bacteroidia bacterium]